MNVCLPVPYPDELLYSVIARYCFYYRVAPSRVMRQLSDKLKVMRADLPVSLDAISAKTSIIWGLSGEEILHTMTLFPFYKPFLPRQRICAEYFLFNSPLRKGGVGLKCYRVQVPTFLRFCGLCADEDLDQYYETYWHRIHQIPGVVVCPIHGVRLFISDVPITLPRKKHFAVNHLTLRSRDLPREQVRDQDVYLAQKIAQRCSEILLGSLGMWQAEDLRTSYIEYALDRGFHRSGRMFCSKMLEKQLLDFYGEALLKAIGISKTLWARYVFMRPSRTQSIHPLEHVLVQIFLENVPVTGTVHPFGVPPWKCPNPYGKHEDDLPIKKIATRTNPRGEVYAKVTCDCGFKFTFDKVASDNLHVPVIRVIRAYGQSWQIEALRLRAAGLSDAEISRKMSLSPSNLTRLMNRRFPVRVDLEEKISAARQAWTKLLISHGSVTSARKQNYGLYQFLRKHDHEWIMSQTGKRKIKIDWTQRDKEWAKRLEEAGKRSLETGGDIVAPSRLLKNAGLNLRIFTELGRLPLCERTIRKYSRPRKHRKN